MKKGVRAPILILLASALAVAQEQTPGRATLEVSPREATVGDLLQATLVLELPAWAKLEPPELGSSFGSGALMSFGAPLA